MIRNEMQRENIFYIPYLAYVELNAANEDNA